MTDLVRYRRSAAESKVYLGLDLLAVDFEYRVGQEVNRSGYGQGIDYQVAATAEFDTVGGVPTEEIRCQRRALVGLGNVDRPPFSIDT